MLQTESDFLQFAFSKYDNPKLSSIKEFEADLKRFVYLNNLLNRYRIDRFDLKDRLIINHLIILGNCFTVQGLINMLNFKITEDNKVICDTFLYYLGNIAKVEDRLDFYLLDIIDAN
jgi:hypothetical protein